MSKYEVLPQQLIHEGTLSGDNFFAPAPADEKEILKTHDADYWHRLKNLELSNQEIRRTGFPLTRELVDREIIIAQGTIDCTKFSLQHGIALNIAGGTHHAFTDRGEGFCLLNDMALAANYLLNNQLVKKILIIDLDVHQGNGTAQIFQHDPRVFTFSMHGANNYPLHKEKSDLDIALPDHTDDKSYLILLDRHLKELMNNERPDFIFYQSGVDVLATDKLGRLALTREGCKKRDKFVLNIARQTKTPIVVSMGGGYSPDFRDIIEAHANTYRLAQEIFF
ncbi:histone deacetylase [Chryseotalea sanaruensis]|uniref:Histone deacetylase n=2 Tax=Chryseotalea sanaruensis TaxID=2482724 RepID=A0A401UE26_9BACT|nr:histone deacetylase [Chryseotalea sanaruensis]